LTSYSSGALSKRSALKVAYFRGCLAGELGKISDTKGAMLAVGLSQFNIGPYFKKVSETSGPLRLVVACVNSPTNITVSGDSEQIEYLERLLTEDDIFSRKLIVNVAYHSFQMEEVAARYEAVLGNLEVPCHRMKRRPTMISSVTGKLIHRDELAKPAYWVRNMVSPVLFADALRNLCTQPAKQTKKIDGSHRHSVRVNHLLEIGPHSALQGPCKEILKAANMNKNIGYIASLQRYRSAVRSVLECVGHLHCEGYPVNVSLVNLSSTKPGRVLVDLPEYPFNHNTSYWHESRHSKNFRLRNTGRLDLLGIKDVDGNPMEAHWRNIISVGNLPWVKDHKINDEILYPAAGMVVMAVEAIKQLVDVNRRVSGFSVKDCKFLSPIRIAAQAQGIETSFHMKRVKLEKSDTTGWYQFRVCSYDKETWTENCTGSIQATYESSEPGLGCKEHEDAKWQAHLSKHYHDIAQRCTVSVDPAQFYKDLIPSGYQYGHAFAAIIGLSTNQIDPKELVSTIRTFRGSSLDNSNIVQPHTIHPATLDAVIHTMTAMTLNTGAQRRVIALPKRIEELWICNSGALSYSAADTVKTYAYTEGSSATESRYSMAVFDKEVKQSLLTLDGLGVAEVENTLVPEGEDAWVTEDLCHHVYWKPDVHLFGPKEVDAFFPKCGVGSMDTIQLREKIELLASIYISRVPKSLIEQARTRSPPHMVRYIDWLATQQDAIRFRLSSSCSLDWRAYMEDEQLLSDLQSGLHGGTKRSHLASTVGKNLSKIISGDTDPISVCFEGNLLPDFYFEMVIFCSLRTDIMRR
jgi:acyl transferase domain-containing protein